MPFDQQRDQDVGQGRAPFASMLPDGTLDMAGADAAGVDTIGIPRGGERVICA